MAVGQHWADIGQEPAQSRPLFGGTVRLVVEAGFGVCVLVSGRPVDVGVGAWGCRHSVHEAMKERKRRCLLIFYQLLRTRWDRLTYG